MFAGTILVVAIVLSVKSTVENYFVLNLDNREKQNNLILKRW